MEAGKCPKCGKTNLDYGEMGVNDTSLACNFNCPDCGFKGVEVKDVEFSHFEDGNGNEIHEQQENWPYTGGGKGE